MLLGGLCSFQVKVEIFQACRDCVSARIKNEADMSCGHVQWYLQSNLWLNWHVCNLEAIKLVDRVARQCILRLSKNTEIRSATLPNQAQDTAF